MTNNDFLRRLRYALNLKDNTMIKIFKLGKKDVSLDDILGFLKKENIEDGFKKLNNEYLMAFLDGLIIFKRGEKKDGKPVAPVKITKNNLNNVILRKLRIALSFKSYDMIEVFHLGGTNLSEGELSALFRAEDHPNYRECGDKYIRVFLKGLIEYYRK